MCLLFQKKVKNSKLHTHTHTHTHTEQFSALGYACRKHNLQQGSFLVLVYIFNSLVPYPRGYEERGWFTAFITYCSCFLQVDFPGGSDGKSICLQCRRLRFESWIRKIPWRRNGNSLQYSCLENPMDRGAWQATFHGVAENWT